MRTLGHALLLVAALAAAPARAQTTPFLYGSARLGERDAPRISRDAAFDLSVEGGLFSDTVLWVLGPLPVRSITGGVSARARVGPVGIELDVPAQQGDVPLMVFGLDPNDEPHLTPGHTALGNVNGSVFGVGDIDFDRARLTLRGGLGLAGPSSDFPSRWHLGSPLVQVDVTEIGALEEGFNVARAQSGQWQDYRFAFSGGDRWTVFAPLGAEMWIDRIGYLALDGIVSVQVGRPGFVSAALALALEGGIDLWSFLRVSVRVVGYGELARTPGLAAWYGLPLSTDSFQMSAEPRVTLAYGPIFGRIGFLVNLDRPWGLLEPASSLITYPVWSLRGTAGVRF